MISIKDLRHKVWLCSAQDVIVAPGEIEIARQPVLWASARIQPKRGQQFAASGFAAHDEAEKPSHEITIRFRPDVDIHSTAWLYEERLQSGRRWYKVLDHHESECGRWVFLRCRLVEKGVTAPPPSAPAPATSPTLPPAAPLPPGVIL